MVRPYYFSLFAFPDGLFTFPLIKSTQILCKVGVIMEREAIKEWFRGLKEEFLGDMPSVTLPLLTKIGEYALHFLAAFILAGARVLGDRRPFAIAMSAASGATAAGFFALMGALGGLVVMAGLPEAVGSIAVAVVAAAISFLFKDLDVARARWFQPVVAGAMTAVIGFVYLLDEGFTLRGLLIFLGESGFTALCTYFFAAALDRPGGQAWRAGLLLMAAGLISALAPVQLLGMLSLGRFAASAAALLAAQAGGWALGGALGLAAGCAVDLAGTGSPWFALTCGISALTAGLARSQSRHRAALAYLVTTGICLVWLADLAPVAALLEAFLASLLLMLLPQQLTPKLGLLHQHEGGAAERSAARRLSDTAAVFLELFESISTALAPENAGATSLGSAFDRTAQRTCKKCMMRSICWQRDAVDTYGALNDASVKFTQRGYAEAGDFPAWFASRCRWLDRFISTLNEELTAMNYRRRYEKNAAENRRLVTQQYRQISDMLQSAADKAAAAPRAEPRLQRKLSRYLRASGSAAEAAVSRDGFGRLVVELTGVTDGEALALKQPMARLLGTRLQPPRQVAGGMIYTESERYLPIVGVTARCRKGESDNGDCGLWFRDGDGRLFIILSDGQGTGLGAKQESQAAVKVLEKLLRAGSSPESAVKTLDSAYTLRGGGGGFATIDLFDVDLFTGRTGIIKWGASPSYVRKNGRVLRIGQPGLPPGTGSEFERQELLLEEGDLVVLCSDGLVDREEDQWLRTVLEAYEGTSPRELASRLVAVAEQTRGLEDDMTVMVLTLQQRDRGAIAEKEEDPQAHCTV